MPTKGEEEGSAHLTLVFESLAYRLLLILIIISNLCEPSKVILMVMLQANGKLNNNIQSASNLCNGAFTRRDLNVRYKLR